MTELINSVWIIVCNPCSASEYINLIPLLGPLSRWCGNASSYAGASSHNTRINLQNGRKVPTTFAPRPSDFVFHIFISKGWVQFTFMYIYRTHLSVERSIYSFFLRHFTACVPQKCSTCIVRPLWRILPLTRCFEKEDLKGTIDRS